MKKIAPDKWKHFFVGIAMGLFLQAVSRYFLAGYPVWAIAITFIIIVAISYGFEVFSLITGRGHYEVMDAVAAVIGGILGMAFIMLLEFHQIF